MAQGDVYDEARAVTDVAEAIRPTLVTDRFKYDQAAVEDVIRIVRATLRASGTDRPMNAELV